jgi:hypothetical protein
MRGRLTATGSWPLVARAVTVLGRNCQLALVLHAVTIRDIEAFPLNSNTLSRLFQPAMSTFPRTFQSILDAADKYAEQTGMNLNENPFADKVKSCDTPSAVLSLLQENLKAFKDYRDNNRKFIDCISPVVQFVHAFSGILGEAAGLVSCDQSSCHRFVYSFSTRYRSNPPNSYSSGSMFSSRRVP